MRLVAATQSPLKARRASVSPRASWALAALALCLGLVGCGDEETTVARTRGTGQATPAAGAAPGKAAGSGAAAGATDESRIPAKLRGLKPEDWDVSGDLPVLLREARDPFMPFVADLVEVKAEEVVAEGDPQLDIRVKIADDVRTLELIAVVSGSGVPHAMVRDAAGLGHILIPGDVVGAEIPFRVARITRNEVLFKPLQAPEGESSKPTEVSKVLLTQQELEDLLP